MLYVLPAQNQIVDRHSLKQMNEVENVATKDVSQELVDHKMELKANWMLDFIRRRKKVINVSTGANFEIHLFAVQAIHLLWES